MHEPGGAGCRSRPGRCSHIAPRMVFIGSGDRSRGALQFHRCQHDLLDTIDAKYLCKQLFVKLHRQRRLHSCRMARHAQVFQHAAPKLVPMIEAGELTGIELILKSYLEPLIANHMDTLILGCTHYPILKSQIEQFLPPNVRLICQNEIISEKLISYLTRHPGIESTLTKSSSHRFLVTKLTPHFKKEAKAWFGDDINLELVNY